MNTEYKYFYFELMTALGSDKKQSWFCISKGGRFPLGVVKWFSDWKQFCFFPEEETVFSVGCLNDVIDFINQLNA